MFKLTVSRTVKRVFNWALQVRKYGRHRSLSDHRATNLAVRLTISGALAPPRRVPSRLRHN